MLILGLETSCDETACALVENGTKVLSNVVASQIPFHKKFFGVVPEIASRKHLEYINSVIDETLKQSGTKKIEAVAVTQGPGLMGSLVIGVMTAKAIAFVRNIPLVPVNHLEAHLFANFLDSQPIKPPFLGFIVSGGHTDLVYVRDYFQYKVLGRTRDDAVGEAYDKVAKLLKLGYPGGPLIDKLAKQGNPQAINFPRPYLPTSWDFSFSGLKTAVVNYVSRFPSPVFHSLSVADLCASFQESVVETLVWKVFKAAEKMKTKKIVLGGGVSANSRFRECLTQRAQKEGYRIYIPPLKYCTDNAAMIAGCGYYKYKFLLKKNKKLLSDFSLRPDPNLPLVKYSGHPNFSQ